MVLPFKHATLQGNSYAYCTYNGSVEKKVKLKFYSGRNYEQIEVRKCLL